MSNLTVKPVALKQGKSGSDFATISIRITTNRVSKYKRTVYAVPLDYWDGDKIKDTYPNSGIMNAGIASQVAEIYKDLFLLMQSTPLTQKVIHQYLTTGIGTDKRHSFTKYVMKHIEYMMRSHHPKGSIVNTQKHLDKIHQYAGDAELFFEDIDARFLKGYEIWMRERGNSQATIWDCLTKFIRKFHHLAKEEYPDYAHNPFLGYKKPQPPRETNKTYLTIEELDLIENSMDKMTEEEKRIANYFLLECYSGIRFSDWERFKVERLVVADKLQVRAKKNGEPIYLTLAKRPRLRAVISRLEPLTGTLEHINRTLKIIAAKSGITKNVSTHVGRHTFAVGMTELGYSVEFVAEMLGVSIKTASWYQKVTRRKLALEEEKLGGF